MKVKYSFICEAANISDSGNLNVLGIFQNINAKDFPTVIPRIIYAACIEFHRSETGAHYFKVDFTDDDGYSVIPPLEQTIILYEDNLHAHLLLGLENIRLVKPGVYAANLTINNQQVVTDTIRVYKVSPDKM